MTIAVVEIMNHAFDPVRKTAQPGTTVTWENVGTADHARRTVQFHGVAVDWAFRTQTLRPHDTVVYAFDEKGIYEYYSQRQGEDMCGVVFVGDVSLPDLLTCE